MKTKNLLDLSRLSEHVNIARVANEEQERLLKENRLRTSIFAQVADYYDLKSVCDCGGCLSDILGCVPYTTDEEREYVKNNILQLMEILRSIGKEEKECAN